MAVFLNAPELESEAMAKPYGRDRDIWVNVWKPFATVSRALYLDQPRAWLDDAIGRGNEATVFELPPASETPTATETPKQVGVRTPTKDAPLRLWVGGDSMSKVLGEAIVRQAQESGFFNPVQDSQLSSGLVRPDFFDWPGHFNELIRDPQPNEVFIVIFGANDDQGIKTPDDKIFQPEGKDWPGWEAEYRRRVAGTMDVLKADGRLVVWVGQPVMRDADLSAAMERLNTIYREEAARRPWVRYFDMWEIFQGKDGKFASHIRDDDGQDKEMRHPDGVHLVRDGGEFAARRIMDLIEREAKLETAPPVDSGVTAR